MIGNAARKNWEGAGGVCRWGKKMGRECWGIMTEEEFMGMWIQVYEWGEMGEEGS